VLEHGIMRSAATDPQAQDHPMLCTPLPCLQLDLSGIIILICLVLMIAGTCTRAMLVQLQQRRGMQC
jgi:hypothetical protein